MVCRTALLAQAVGAVGEHDRRDAEPVHRLGVPEIRARHERRLLGEGHPRAARIDGRILAIPVLSGVYIGHVVLV
ncbi:hypothetical protein GCM10009620_07520 [Microbacterium thalassium]